MKYNKKKVSIILPVYNAGDFTIKCINSVLESKTNVPYELIIVDDCSKENGLYEKLLQFKTPDIKIYQNSKNLGFVKTCNNAIKLSEIENDIILLNSDTEVTDYWLDKMQENAYSSIFIGTVTPLSNNGSICSMPQFCKNNNIPNGYDKDSLNKLTVHTNLYETYVLPTCVGFCTYIKRSVLNLVGLLDDKKYGKGYGEENDFSMRVIKAGYVNALDSSTFIYHKGNASFLTGDSFSTENYKKLINDYPNYPNLVQDFISKTPLRKYLNLSNILINNKVFNPNFKRILNIYHYESAIGGVGLFVQKISSEIDEKIAFINLKLRVDGVNIQYYDQANVLEEIFIENTKYQEIYLFHELIIKQIVELFDIDIIHFHHLLGSSIKLLELPSSIGVGSILTLHDLYLINESTDFLFKPEKYSHPTQGRPEIALFINKLDYLVYPTNYLMKYFNSTFNLDTNQLIIDNGTNLEKIKREFAKKETLNLTFLGSTVKTKGIDVFLKLVSEFKGSPKFRFYVFGYKSPDLEKYTNDLGLIEGVDYIHKEYNNSEVSNLLIESKSDLVIFPSNVPESYSYTLSESVMNSIPVIGRNVGAIGERIKEGNYGWVFNTYDELINTANTIYNDQKLLEEKINTLNSVIIPRLKEISSQYGKLYKKLKKVKGDNIVEVVSLKQKLLSNNDNALNIYNPVANSVLQRVNSNVWLLKRIILNLFKKKRF